MSNIKQVIVMRKDLNMRKGKIAAQAAHASMKVLVDALIPHYTEGDYKQTSMSSCIISYPTLISWTLPKLKYFEEWLTGRFKKICAYVDSEEELDKLYLQAEELGIHCSIIVDSGLTEFHGVPTKTCIAIGPCEAERIDKITGHLKLL